MKAKDLQEFKNLKIEIKPKYHFWFWVIYFLLNALRWGAYFNDYAYSFKSNIIEFSLHIPLVYLNLFFLVPRYVLKPHYLKYGFALLFSLFVVYLLKTGLTYYVISENIWPEANREYRPFELNHILAVCIGELYVVSMASSIYFVLTWLKEKERNRALSESQFKIKLKYLKNQIQPHFFFNTLNNLYSLSLASSEKVPMVILKLSKLMEYVLYEINGIQYVSLLKEIDYMQNYIEIEKLRFENVVVTFNIHSNIDHVKVPPLLFISLIENSFKHGGQNNKNRRIKMNIEVLNNSLLHFEILNNFVPSQDFNPRKGIGLQNTKKRLKLLYKNKFSLEQDVKLNYFIVRLKIPIYEN